MGIPVANTQTPPAGDLANAVVSGTLSAVGASALFSALGAFNVLVWGSVATPLTTTANSSSASVSSGAGISAGMSVKSINVPPGTTWATFSGTSGTLAFPPGYTNANVTTGTDNAASFGTVAVSATVQLERSFDGGSAWLVCNIGGGGQLAQYTNPQAVSFVNSEPENGVLYRLNCTAYSSGTINYRFSTTSPAATAWGIPPG